LADVESNRDDAALQAPPALSNDLANMTALTVYGSTGERYKESGSGGFSQMSRDRRRTVNSFNNINKKAQYI
jgi:hypothetical protein